MAKFTKKENRCKRCKMHFERCICSEIPELNLATRLALIMHYREVPKPSATGPLALEALPNHRFFIHGARDARVDLQPLLDEPRRPLLLFPSDDARVLSKELLEEDPRPVTLIVPDGNWGQARRAVKRIPGLEQVERVVLAPGPPTRWGLRAEPTLDGLSTFEAIARAFGVLEGERVQRELESLFDKMVQASIAARGAAPRIHRNDVANAKTPPLEILYQDEALVVVQKPSGSLVHRGWANDEEPVLQQLRDQIGKRVYPVHRLDRATSGALLFALSAEVCAQLQESFDAKTVDKRYLALSRGSGKIAGVIDHPLAKEKGGEKREAKTRVRRIGQFERYGLYDVQPITGRTHQIRRHFKHLRQPLIGDTRYGTGPQNQHFRDNYGFRRLALHCYRLAFPHPVTGEQLTVDAPLAPELRQLFSDLDLLKSVPNGLA